MSKAKNQDLPGVAGEGVSLLEIPEIVKAIAKYEKKKEARCAESPGEMEAKRELKAVLHMHRSKLPLDAEGIPFYRADDKDYRLEEKISIKKVGGDEDEV